MNNSDKEKILKSVFVDKQVEIRENLCWVKYPRNRIVFVIKENECELGLEISNGRPVPKSLAQFVYALFKNEKDIKICAILKQSFEEQKGTKYDPLSKDDFLLESNEINWNKIASLTWFSMYFEETDFEKVKDYMKMFQQKIDENMDEIKEILSEDSDQEQERLLMQRQGRV